MRQLRVVVLLAVCVTGLASRADAWWGWIDELSGPKGFKGLQFDIRARCFGAPPNPTYVKLLDVLAKQRALTGATHDLVTAVTARIRARSGGSSAPPAPQGAPTVLEQWEELEHRSTEFEAQLEQALRRLDGQYITRAQVQQLLGDKEPYERLTTHPEIDPRDLVAEVSSPLRAFNSAAVVLMDARREALEAEPFALLAAPFLGVRLSLCGPRDDDERRFSIGLLTRVYFASDHSADFAAPGDPRDYENFAGGRQMYMFAAGPTIEWRPLYFQRENCGQVDCQHLWGWDWVDLGGTLSYYQIGSAGFRSTLRGATLSGYTNVRLPAHIVRHHAWARAVPVVRIARTGFLGGFDANAFGPKLTGPKAQSISGPDFNTEISFFIDLGSVF